MLYFHLMKSISSMVESASSRSMVVWLLVSSCTESIVRGAGTTFIGMIGDGRIQMTSSGSSRCLNTTWLTTSCISTWLNSSCVPYSHYCYRLFSTLRKNLASTSSPEVIVPGVSSHALIKAAS